MNGAASISFSHRSAANAGPSQQNCISSLRNKLAHLTNISRMCFDDQPGMSLQTMRISRSASPRT